MAIDLEATVRRNNGGHKSVESLTERAPVSETDAFQDADCSESEMDVCRKDSGVTNVERHSVASEGTLARASKSRTARRSFGKVDRMSDSCLELRSMLERSRIIPAIRKEEHLSAALASPSSVIFLMCGTPANIDKLIWKVKDKGKIPIANLDLLPGFARDSFAVEFLAEAGIAGIISTHQDVLRAARSFGLIAFQRTFAIDSAALSNCLRRLRSFVPDVMELLPAVAGPIVLPKLRASFPNLLVIGCGLVTSVKQVDDLVLQGVMSVSACEPSLWVL